MPAASTPKPLIQTPASLEAALGLLEGFSAVVEDEETDPSVGVKLPYSCEPLRNLLDSSLCTRSIACCNLT